MVNSLSAIQFNILIASIIGDGEITKLYPKSRRKNNSYREHYGIQQIEYRKWKEQIMDGLFYLTPKSNTLRSKSSQLFTELYPLFYNAKGQKQIPVSLLPRCILPHFLAALYMDDGSLCITSRINHRKKIIYLTPQVYLYLQNYSFQDLTQLNNHIKVSYNIELKFGHRNDGHGHILRTISVDQALKYLHTIQPVAKSCPSMFYKTSWDFRLRKDTKKYNSLYPDYQVLSSNSSRSKAYDEIELDKMISLKKQGITDNEIADTIGRTYWSVVYKLSELRKQKGKFNSLAFSCLLFSDFNDNAVWTIYQMYIFYL
ncbi:hypothetical protein JOC34_003369 [Virgibacillus halotolerans]|uniref:DNA endonuclease n=1 Tax=Virgibacillus halotolerans TaxID=1071053 RepID=UPI0019601DB9|nr:DNA endonuclease [Virgibacillus halotolerans]MBM7600948.1 hypothetical protein [Virgibacillus halotolerans]